MEGGRKEGMDGGRKGRGGERGWFEKVDVGRDPEVLEKGYGKEIWSKYIVYMYKYSKNNF